MANLITASDMQEGKVYNLVYVGVNAAYAKINGKRTYLVVATSPKLQCIQLHAQFGFPRTEDVRSNTITFHSPEIAFEDSEISEPASEDEWFKHSLKFTSLAKAIEFGVLAPDDVTFYQNQRLSNRSVSVSGEGGVYLGVYLGFNVEDKTIYPNLQRVYIWWNTWDAMKADFKLHGVELQS